MNKRVNELKIGIIISYFSTGVNIIVQLIYTPIMIRLLGQSEYGIYTLVGSIVSYLSLFSLGFTGAYLRFYSRFSSQDDEKGVARLNGMFLTLFSLMSLAAIVCGMILVQFPTQIFGSKLTASELKTAQILMAILVFNIALTFPCSLMDSIVSAHEKFLFQRLLSLAGIVANPFVCLPLLLLGYGSVAVVSVTTAITVAKLLCNLWYCRKKLHVKFYFHGFKFSLLSEIGAFSFFLFLNMIIDQINWNVDKLILGHAGGSDSVAVYGVASQLNSMVMTFSTTISSVFAPRINRIAATQGKSAANSFTALFIKVGRIQFLVLGLIASGLVVFGRYFILNIYAGAGYAQAYPAALLLILPALIPLCQNLGLEIQRSVNKHQFRSIIYAFMAVINVVISIPLAQRFGPVGAAMGTAFSLLVANGLIMNIYYQKVIGMDIVAFWKSIFSCAKGLLIPAVFGAVIMNFVTFNGLVQYFGLILIYTLVYCGSMWCFGMNQDEKNLVIDPLKKVVGRIRKT